MVTRSQSNAHVTMSGFAPGLLAVLAWGALSFGAVYPWGYWPMAVASAGLGAWAIWTTRAWEDPRVRSLAWAALAIAIAIGVQTIALPYSLLIRLSPSVDSFFREFQLAYHPASLHSLSIDQQVTLVALALYVAMALLFIGLLRSLRAVGLEWLLIQVMGLGVSLALVGVFQAALLPATGGQPIPVYGFWTPRQGASPFGPFINKNHFAGWMVMALPLVAGYSCGVVARIAGESERGWRDWLHWAVSEEAGRPLLLAVSVLIMGMSLALTRSRSGLAAFAVAMIVMAVFALARLKSRRIRALAMAYVLVLGLGAVWWAGAGAALARFGSASEDVGTRLAAWRDARHIASDFPLFGTGLGTFRRAMLVYQSGDRQLMFAQAHNEYLQLAAEGGLLVVVPSAVLAFLVVVGIRRRLTSGEDDPLTSWVRAGAVAALAGIAAQSLVEFSLQIPGNRVLFVIVLAIALHRPGRSVSRSRQKT